MACIALCPNGHVAFRSRIHCSADNSALIEGGKQVIHVRVIKGVACLETTGPDRRLKHEFNQLLLPESEVREGTVSIVRENKDLQFLFLERSVEMPEAVIDITARLNHAAERNSEPPCFCASSLAQVESAWRLVYERYSQMGLIDENPFGIHAAPTAVGQHACVIWGPDGPEVGYTMTLFRDNPMGLALDSVYPRHLDELRRTGRRLLEVGMLADRRRCASRGIGVLFAMMRWAIHYGLHTDLTDIVIGVHPRHAQFYVRCYGFEQFASPTSYPLVRNNPVAPLRLRLLEGLAQDELPRGLADARDNPLPASEFLHRFAFEPQKLRGSLIAGFMQACHGIDPCRMADLGRARARVDYGLAQSA